MTDVWPRARRSSRCSTTRTAPGAVRGPRRSRTSRAAAPAASAARTSARCCRCSHSRPSALHARRATTSSSRAAAPSPTACASRPGPLHVCYCHSPFRYAWHEQRSARSPRCRGRCARPGCLMRRASAAFDRRAAARRGPLRRQLADHAGADPPLLGPRRPRRATRPSTSTRFAVGEPGELRSLRRRARRATSAPTSRSRPRRRPAVAITRRRAPGPEPRAGSRRATAARRSSWDACHDEELGRALRRAPRALVVPNVEEFGIAAVEAQAAGRPVVARRRGRRARDRRSRGAPGCSCPPGDRDALCARALRGRLQRASTPAEIHRARAALLARGLPGAAGRGGRRDDRPARRPARGRGLAGQGAHAGGGWGRARPKVSPATRR